MLDDAARTAQQAADGLGVALGQIAKSIVFRRKSDDRAVLVVTSGDRRVDEKKLEKIVSPDGKRLGRADAEFVKSRTGFSIGGVSPLAHATDVLVLVDRSLLRFEEVWAAAGHPHAVFKLMPQELELLTGAPVVDVAVDVDEEQANRQYAIDLLTARALGISATADIVPSPCISVCRIHADSGLCEGCFRTLGEISNWSRSSADAQRQLWQVIILRCGTTAQAPA
ncbi:MAG: YbaK/EbsC family protein, partial [Pseudomonadota bacterium]